MANSFSLLGEPCDVIRVCFLGQFNQPSQFTLSNRICEVIQMLVIGNLLHCSLLDVFHINFKSYCS